MTLRSDSRAAAACLGGLAAILGCLAASTVDAHPADELTPRIELRYEIEATRVIASAYLPARVYLSEALAVDGIAEARALSEREAARRVADWWHARNPVSIDGVPVRPVFHRATINVPEVTFGDLTDDEIVEEFGSYAVEMVYETKGKPRQVDIVWREFLPATVAPTTTAAESEGDAGASPPTDPVMATLLTSWSRRGKLIGFTEREPQYIWHGEASGVPADLSVPVARPRVTVSVPLISAGFVLAAMLFWPVMSRAGFGRGARWAMVVVALAGAVGFHSRATADWELPIERRLARPADDQAVAVFESLHRNIYRAFDYDNESDIYDALAQSVAGPELARVYADVYASLIMAEEGGAVSQVEAVDVVSARVVGDDALAGEIAAIEGPTFEGDELYCVRARWRVTGRVLHWGHTHRRTNEYEGLVAVAPSGGAWRIVARRLLDQRRLDDPAAEPAAVGAADGP